MANGIRTGDPRRFNQEHSSKFHVGSRVRHIGRNVVEITIKMKIIVRKPLMIKQLCVDTGCSPEYLPEAMYDREGVVREGQGYAC